MTDVLSTQRQIAEDLQVPATFDAAAEIERRVVFLADRLVDTGLTTLVLGISGGVDSTTAGRLCQLAAERARAAGHPATFVAMRLPYGVQADEHHAQAALAFIRPDRVLAADSRPQPRFADHDQAADAGPDHRLHPPVEEQLPGGTGHRELPHQQRHRGDEQQRQAVVPPDQQLGDDLQHRHHEHGGVRRQVRREQHRAGEQPEQCAEDPVRGTRQAYPSISSRRVSRATPGRASSASSASSARRRRRRAGRRRSGTRYAATRAPARRPGW
ncbi:hypothetical protein G3554_13400 [Micromonospora sp. PPF5-17]|nr:hypothetical protein [Micromonospora sp. PPF5-17B]NES37150.1 hypothetical protein [Micromonospora solifontis]NES54119.1 hypothetical protein [Micromonospora sp. PPF5-6]